MQAWKIIKLKYNTYKNKYNTFGNTIAGLKDVCTVCSGFKAAISVI